MAIKTFTTGEVLTAADTNTYLANSGLVYIKQQTIGTGVSSVSVSSAFSSTFDNYKIIISGGVGSGLSSLSLTVGTAITAYSSGVVYVTYGASSALGASDNNAAAYSFAGYATTTFIGVNLDVLNPFNSAATVFGPTLWAAGTVAGVSSGIHNAAASHTSFTFTPAAGTLTGGTIYVYGYRKQ